MTGRLLIDNARWGLTGELQALLIEDGKVHYRGPRFESKAIIPTIDLGGRYILPSLIESHCHILNTGLDLTKLNLGAAQTADEVLELVLQEHQKSPTGWLMAVHYDQNRWNGPHITRHQLDGISPDRPILLRHVNGHAGIANSAALAARGYKDDEPNPAGGSFGRDSSGKLDGALYENAFTAIYKAIPKPTLDEMAAAILAAGRSMHQFGIGVAHDLLTGHTDLALELQAYLLAAEQGNPIDVRLYVQWSSAMNKAIKASKLLEPFRLRSYGSRLPVVAGVKIFADGAIGSATAAIYGNYGDDPKPDQERRSGQLMYPPERLKAMIREAQEEGFSVSVHAIGDYATDLVLDAFEAAPPQHPDQIQRIEHAMILSDAQIERMARLGVSVSMQPEFLVRFGQTYRSQLGQARAEKINRTRSLIEAGIPLSLSSDRPIVSGNPWLGMASAVNRPEGFDPNENLTPRQALGGYLSQAAAIGGDSPLVVNLEEGAEVRAIVLDHDPLSASPNQAPISLESLYPSIT